MAAVKERTERDVVLSNLKDMISERIHNYIPEEYKYADIKFMDIMKNNGEELPALVINPEGINVSPTIYLDPFIDAYSANIPDEEILGKIGQLFAEKYKAGGAFDHDGGGEQRRGEERSCSDAKTDTHGSTS